MVKLKKKYRYVENGTFSSLNIACMTFYICGQRTV